MSKGLQFGLSIFGIGCLIPLVTMILTLRNSPTYHTTQPVVEGENCFVQFTWQEKPVLNLEHILIFLEKPQEYTAVSGLDMFPPSKTEGYFVAPRAVFYKNDNILSSLQKVFRMAKKDVRTWIIIQGKAFPIHLTKEQLQAAADFVADEKDHSQVNQKALGQKLLSSSLWKVIKEDLEDKRQKLADGKLDLKPHKRRSDFMR